MSSTVYSAQSRTLKPFRSVLPALVLLAELVGMPGCAAPHAAASRPLSMQVAVGAAAEHRLLKGPVPASLTSGPVLVTAHVFTQPGSLISVFAKVLPSPEPNTFALDVRIPEPLARQPLLVRVSGPRGFFQALVTSDAGVASPLVVQALNDTTTVVAQTYVAARAAQSWPRGTSPDVLTTIISDELALAVRQAPNAERTLAAVTQGVVAAVCAWQAVLRGAGPGAGTLHDDSGALVAALVWHTDAGEVDTGAGAIALQQARSRARCVDCSVSAAQLALAAQAGADAWLVYADKLPWALRSQALVDAAALQAHFMVAMVADAQSGAPNAETRLAAAQLQAVIAAARMTAKTASPTSTAKSLSLAQTNYAQSVWDQIDGQSAERREAWAETRPVLEPTMVALRETRRTVNSRLAPAQAAASLAKHYVAVFTATQGLGPSGLQATSAGAKQRLSAALTVRSSMLAASR